MLFMADWLGWNSELEGLIFHFGLGAEDMLGVSSFPLPFFLGSYLVGSPGQDTAQYTHTI